MSGKPVADRGLAAIWHDIECGAYEGDLRLWSELCSPTGGGPLLDLGCGTGRVSLHLSRDGIEMRGLDLDPDLVAAFNERAADSGLAAAATLGDAREFDLGARFAMVLAPMQLVQIFDNTAERVACMRAAAAHLAEGGAIAIAIVDGFPDEITEEIAEPHLPDVREIDGWVYSSLPLDAGLDAGSIVVRRLRQVVSPAGELSETLDEIPLRVITAETIEDEAREAGLEPIGRRDVAPTDSHIGSTVVLLGEAS